jgi:signal transduction histidine kinase
VPDDSGRGRCATYREVMSPNLLKLRPWLEPAVGTGFFVLWAVAEVGRYQQYWLAGAITLLALSLAIALSRISPLVSFALIASVLLLQIIRLLPPPGPTSWPIYLIMLTVVSIAAFHASKRTTRIVLALGLPFALAFGYLMRLSDSWWGVDRLGGYTDAFLPVSVVALVLYVGAWALGFGLRSSISELRSQLLLRTTAAQLDATEVELRITRERDRIAREVHDVLAHSLAVVIAQADGARFIGQKKPERADDAFHAISDAARSALIDVRTLVEGLREDQGDQPQPGLVDLPPLLDQLRGAGMTIESQHFGAAKTMTPAQQLTVFRVVQESLTNALRHGGRTPTARVSFDWRGPGLAVGITSVGAEPNTEAAVDGHGIRGMKDRARLAGGWLTAGASDTDNDFVVTLFVPTGSERPAEGEAA